MAKASNRTQKQANKNWQQKYFWHFLGLFIVLILTAILWNKFEEYKNKNAFEAAAKDIKYIVNDIKNLVGEPTRVKSDGVCYSSVAKFDQSVLSCAVSSLIIYKNKRPEEANSIMGKIRKLNNTPLYSGSLLTEEGLGEFIRSNAKISNQEFYQKLANINNLSCTISYNYPNYSEDGSNLIKDDEENLVIKIACQGAAKREYYPVKV